LADAALLSPQSIREFFSELLAQAIENQRAQVQPFTALYVTNLLQDFLSPEDPQWSARPLAFMLKDAYEEHGPARVQLLRKLGDTSLFVSGFFPDSLARRSSLVDVDYYIAMGGRAYDAVGASTARHNARDLWTELSTRFRLLVDLLNEVSERTLASTNAGLVRLYERFVKTGSERLQGLLAQQGMVTTLPRRGFVS
jgi:hypothetical protein